MIGTERHTARRIDNQLRGRSGRQGDPGSSRFYVSLEDDLMKMFAGEWVIKVLGWLGMEEGVAIEDKRITKGILNAQKKVEERNFLARKESARLRRSDGSSAHDVLRHAPAGARGPAMSIRSSGA